MGVRREGGYLPERGAPYEDQSFGSWGYRDRSMQRHQHEAEMSITTYM